MQLTLRRDRAVAIWGWRGRRVVLGPAGLAWAHLVTGCDGTAGGRTAFLSPCICIRQPWGAGDLARLQEGTIWKVRSVLFHFLQDFPETNEGKKETR